MRNNANKRSCHRLSQVYVPIDEKLSNIIRNTRLKMANLPRTLTIEEKKYLLAVRRGELDNVQRMIKGAHLCNSLNVNCVDAFGRGAFTLAIDGENIEMIELLVVMGVEPKDAILHAIDTEFVEAIELLLDYEEIVHRNGEKYSWEKVDWNISVYTPEITPVILAAHKNNIEILKILLDRGVSLPSPHQISCGCAGCKNAKEKDSLRQSMARVNEYKALASPALIALSSNDPILTAFKLSWELRHLAEDEKESQKEYTDIRMRCQQFAVDLLDQTRSSEELAIILNFDAFRTNDHKTLEQMTLPRLRMAVEYKQKKFIAHPHVQQLLATIWYDGLPGFRSKSIIGQSMDIIKIAVCYPIRAWVYVFDPHAKIAKDLNKPVMQFLIHMYSYLTFLGASMLVSQRAEVQAIELLGTESMKNWLKEKLKIQRGNGPTIFECCVLMFVLGYLKLEFNEMRRMGMRKYLMYTMWNSLEFAKSIMYIVVICLRIFAYVNEQIQIKNDPKSAFVPREEWSDFDPQLIADSLFATANIISALKLVHMFSINAQLGPLQISLGRMVIDIIKFFLIYALVLFSFACGLNQLLWYYADLEKKKCYLPTTATGPDWDSDSCSKWRHYGNLFESIQTLFWTAFGEVGLENFDLSGIKSYTRFWGLLMFAAYSVINVTVLLTLLIAMMSNSYSRIEEQADTEWKFARTRLWLSTIEKRQSLPPPFNLLPSFQTVRNFYNSMFDRCKPEDMKESAHKKKQDKFTAVIQNYKHMYVMRALVWRYISWKHREMQVSTFTEDDLHEIKNDIASLTQTNPDASAQQNANKGTTAVSRKIRMWERQLMKDFLVAPIFDVINRQMLSFDDLSPQEEEPEYLKSCYRKENETPIDKFRRIAQQVARNSPSSLWKSAIQNAGKQ